MVRPAPVARMTYAEYLATEAKSEIRHEFLNGEVWAMSGGTPEHSALAAAVIRELGASLRGKPCRTFTSDLRVRILDTGLSTYPDVSVVCGQLKTAPEDEDAITKPIVLVEVYRRAESGRWELLEARSGETIELASLGTRLEVASNYASPLGQ